MAADSQTTAQECFGKPPFGISRKTCCFCLFFETFELSNNNLNSEEVKIKEEPNNDDVESAIETDLFSDTKN